MLNAQPLKIDVKFMRVDCPALSETPTFQECLELNKYINFLIYKALIPMENIIDTTYTRKFYRYCEENDLKRVLIRQRLSWNLIRVDMQQKRFIYFFQHLNYYGWRPTLLLSRNEFTNIMRTNVTPFLPTNFFKFFSKQVYLQFEDRQVHDAFRSEEGKILLVYSGRDA